MSTGAFLAMTKEELNGRPLDVLLITGDAYVDLPLGVSLIGRWLEIMATRLNHRAARLDRCECL